MRLFFDFFPLILFFGAFRLYDIYVATAVAMAASVLQVAIHWFRHRRFEATHVVTLVIIVVFGGLTLILHDDTFIKWKPTLVYWTFAVILMVSQARGTPAIRKLLGGQVGLPDLIWSRLNVAWGAFFVVLGGVNLYVAFWYRLDLDAAARQSLWVNFKVFWLLGITLVFALAQGFYMSRHMADPCDPHKGDARKDPA